MARHTDATTDESLETVDDFAGLEAGDEVTITYKSNQTRDDKTVEGVVDDVTVTEAFADGVDGWVDVEVCVDDETIPSRRIAVDDAGVELESRSTTIDGTEWRRMSAIGTDAVRVTTTSDETVDDDTDDDQPEAVTDGGVDTTLTGHTFKDPVTCGLYASGHRIATDFADVLRDFEDAFDAGTTADVVAGGCNGCTTPSDDADVWAYYVAQGTDDVDTLYVGYGADDDAAIGSKLVAYILVGIAEDHGVPVSWNGETSKKVCLGDADAYDDE